jgi:hypothetical protein
MPDPSGRGARRAGAGGVWHFRLPTSFLNFRSTIWHGGALVLQDKVVHDKG